MKGERLSYRIMLVLFSCVSCKCWWFHRRRLSTAWWRSTRRAESCCRS